MARPGLFNESFQNPDRFASTSRYPEAVHSKIPALLECEFESEKARIALNELLQKKDQLKRNWKAEEDEIDLLAQEYRLNDQILERVRNLEERLSEELRDLEKHHFYTELEEVKNEIKNEMSKLEILRQELQTDSEDILFEQVKQSNKKKHE